MAINLAYQSGMQVRIAEQPQSKTVQEYAGEQGTIASLLSRDVALIEFDGRLRQVLVEDLRPAQPVQMLLF